MTLISSSTERDRTGSVSLEKKTRLPFRRSNNLESVKTMHGLTYSVSTVHTRRTSELIIYRGDIRISYFQAKSE